MKRCVSWLKLNVSWDAVRKIIASIASVAPLMASFFQLAPYFRSSKQIIPMNIQWKMSIQIAFISLNAFRLRMSAQNVFLFIWRAFLMAEY